MDTTISQALVTATVLFGGVVVLAVGSTGFWLGLKWLRKTEGNNGGRWTQADHDHYAAAEKRAMWRSRHATHHRRQK